MVFQYVHAFCTTKSYSKSSANFCSILLLGEMVIKMNAIVIVFMSISLQQYNQNNTSRTKQTHKQIQQSTNTGNESIKIEKKNRDQV
jgi:hypothetical protein